MSPAYILLLLLAFFLLMGRSRKKRIVQRNIQKRNKEERVKMTELAKNFLDKECLIYTFNDHAVIGVLKEVADGAVLVDCKGTMEAVNIDFVVRIREYPRNKKGKKKTIFVE